VGRDSALVIDCGLNPDSGARVLAAARKLAPGRKLILTTTHAHPEHAFGAAPFKGQAEYVLNSAQNDYLVKAGPAIREMFKGFGPDITRMLASAEIVPATRTYDGDRAPRSTSVAAPSNSATGALRTARATRRSTCQRSASCFPVT